MKSLPVVTRAQLLIQQGRCIIKLVRGISLILELGVNLVLVWFRVTQSLVNFLFFLISNKSSDWLGAFLVFLFFNMWGSNLFVYWYCFLVWGFHCIWAVLAFSFLLFLNFWGIFLMYFIHNFKFVFLIFYLLLNIDYCI
jgi:hypothetical protein